MSSFRDLLGWRSYEDTGRTVTSHGIKRQLLCLDADVPQRALQAHLNIDSVL